MLTQLNKYQKAAFHKVYTDRAVNQVVSEMNRDPFARKTGAFVDEENSLKTAQKELKRLQGKNQGVLEI